jgi:hypothetical protein
MSALVAFERNAVRGVPGHRPVQVDIAGRAGGIEVFDWSSQPERWRLRIGGQRAASEQQERSRCYPKPNLPPFHAGRSTPPRIAGSRLHRNFSLKHFSSAIPMSRNKGSFA